MMLEAHRRCASNEYSQYVFVETLENYLLISPLIWSCAHSVEVSEKSVIRVCAIVLCSFVMNVHAVWVSKQIIRLTPPTGIINHFFPFGLVH